MVNYIFRTEFGGINPDDLDSYDVESLLAIHQYVKEKEAREAKT